MTRRQAIAAGAAALAVVTAGDPVVVSQGLDLSAYPGRLVGHEQFEWRGKVAKFSGARVLVDGEDVSMRTQWVEPMTGKVGLYRMNGGRPVVEVATSAEDWHDRRPGESMRDSVAPAGRGRWKVERVDTRIATETITVEPSRIKVTLLRESI